jgi:hypothetical protein
MFPASGPIRIPLQILCNSDMEAHIRVSAFTEDNVECNRATFQVWQLESESEFAGQRNSKLTFTFKDLIEVPTFLDYLRAGWTISFSTAIDYTSSNGLYTNPTSLHFISS